MSSFKDFLILSEVESTVNQLELICEHQYVDTAKALLNTLYHEFKKKDSGDSYHDEVEAIILEINGLMKHLPPFVEAALKEVFTKLTSEVLGFEQEDVPERILSTIVFSHYAKLVVFEYIVSNLVNNSIDPSFKAKLEEFADSIYQILCAKDNQKIDDGSEHGGENKSWYKGLSHYRNSIIIAKSVITTVYRFIQLLKHKV